MKPKRIVPNVGRRMKTGLRHVVARQLERRVQELIAKKHLKVVGVTGSVGKTSTKLAIASVLQQKYRVQVHRGNFNSEIGLPLAIFDLDVPSSLTNPLQWFKVLEQIDTKLAEDFPYDVLVLELGVDAPGDMDRHLRYLTPDIGVVTAIAPVHVENLGSIDAVAKEKMALAKASRAVLLNAEDERVMTESKSLVKPVQTYGVGKGEVHFKNIRREENLCLTGVLILNDGEVTTKTQFIGRHGLSALAAAAAVGEELGLTAEQIKVGVEAAEPFSGRMRLLKGINDSIIIDDSYNASPRSTVAALETLAELRGRHLAILGSMNELGDYSDQGHREVGAAAKNVDLLITIGEQAAKYTTAGAVKAGISGEKIHSFRSPYKAGEYLCSKIKPGDIVLVKGSQNGVFAEEAVAQLLANPEDRNKLVRQGQEWGKRKHEQFN